MAETRYLDEYILNDVGKVYTKGIGKPIGLKWIYAQFSAPILPVLKKVIELYELYEEGNGTINEEKRGDVVEMSRILKAVSTLS